MPPRNRRAALPILGQEALDIEVPSHVRPLGKQSTLIGILTPEKLNLQQENYALGQVDFEAVDPNSLAQNLYDIGTRSEHGLELSYFDPQMRRPRWVGLTPEEYSKLIHSTYRGLGRTAASRSLKGVPESIRFDADVQARAQRASTHAYEAKLAAAEPYLVNVLQPRKELLDWFDYLARHRHFSHIGPEDKLLIQLTQYRGVVDSALEAVGLRRDWNREDITRARKAIEWNIVFDRKANRNIDNFAALTRVLWIHNNHKIALFKDRIEHARQQTS